MTTPPAQVREWTHVDPERFRSEILPAARPAVLKGRVAGWPAVERAGVSPRALADYLQDFDRGRPADILLGDPSIRGRLFYGETLQSLNFRRGQAPIRRLVEQLIGQMGQAGAPTVCVQSADIADHLPGFLGENSLGLVPESTRPRIWIGNQVVVSAHFDPFENIACVVGGRRRFTFFPPEQIANLYIGPLEPTPGGAPISLVDFDNPDLARFPRFADAMAAAEVAEVEAGDAVYIPYLWWHHVRSLDPFNVLVNYWWSETEADGGSPFDWLLHGLLTLRDLPPAQRAAWKAVFDHYVFRTGDDPVAHFPAPDRGVLGALEPAERHAAIAGLARSLNAWASRNPPT